VNYLIEYDTRKVIHTCKSDEDMQVYIEEHDLDKYAGLVNDEDDICLIFSEREAADIYKNLIGKKPHYKTEEELGNLVWKALCSGGENPEPKPKAPAKKAKPKSSPKKIDIPLDAEISVVSARCKKGSILHTLVTAIDEEMCSTVEEVIEYVVDNHLHKDESVDEKFAVHNIKYFLKKGNLALS